jgi:HEAT repeat protein
MKRVFRLSCLATLAVFCSGIPTGCGPGSLWNRLFPPPAEEMVEMATDADDADRRRQGLMMLSSQPYGTEDKFVEVYVNVLQNDPEPTVRSAAARAIGKSENGNYAGQLSTGLADPVAQVRWDTAIALDSVVGQPAVGPLGKAATEDESKDVRAAAALALRHYPDRSVVATLVDCLSDRSFAVQFQARKALVDMTGYQYGYNPEPWSQIARGEKPLNAPGREYPWWDLFKLTDPES